MRPSVWRLLVIASVGASLASGACSKKKSVCQKRCEGILKCFKETRGAVKNEKGSLKRCQRICSRAAGHSPGQRATRRWAKKPRCVPFMRRHLAGVHELFGLKKIAAAATDDGPAAAATVAGGPHPFPDLVGRPPDDPRERRTWKSPVRRLVDRVELTRGGKTVELHRVKAGEKVYDYGEWNVKRPVTGRADRHAVRNLLSKLERMQFQEIISNKPSDFATYQVDEAKGTRCKVYAGRRLLADMIVGKYERVRDGRRMLTSSYVRPARKNDIWRVNGSLTYIFNKSPQQWRDSTVISIRRADITQLKITTPHGEITVRRDAGASAKGPATTEWTLVSSNPPISGIDQQQVSRIVSRLAYLRANSSKGDPSVDVTGLDRPGATVTVSSKDGQSTSILIGNYDEKTKSAYAKVKDGDRVFQVREPIAGLRNARIGTFRDKTLVQATTGDVVGLRVEKGNEVVEVKKAGGTWKAVLPEDLDLHQTRVLGAVRLLERRFAAHDFASAQDAVAAGLDPPAGRVVLTLKDARTIELLVGKDAGRGMYHIQVKGSSDIFLIRRWVLQRVWMQPSQFSRTKSKSRQSSPIPRRAPDPR